MLRNLNLARNAKRICGTPQVGVLGSAVPTGGPAFALLLGEVQTGGLANRYVRLWVESSTLPPGTLFVYEDSSWSATGAPPGSYTIAGRLIVDDADQAAVTYSVTVGPSAGTVALRNLNLVRDSKRICGTPKVGVPGSAVPTLGPPYALLFNDVQTYGLANELLRIWIESSTFPAGSLWVYENSSYTFTGSPIANGTYSAQGRLFVADVDQGTAAFTVTVGG